MKNVSATWARENTCLSASVNWAWDNIGHGRTYDRSQSRHFFENYYHRVLKSIQGRILDFDRGPDFNIDALVEQNYLGYGNATQLIC